MWFTLLVIVTVVLFSVYFTFRKRAKEFSNGKIVSNIIGTVGTIFLFFSIMQFFTIVDAGTVRVVKLWGTVKEDGYLEEGINIINPFCSLKEMTVRTQ